jgi:DNA (cytosine-5)-methyltransferase 1
MRKLTVADLYCGAGGTSQGARQSGAAELVFALNHWEIAVQTHSANFPGTKHVNRSLADCNPSECPAIDLLFASPECTHFSRARGSRPTSDQQRAGAWDVLKWVEFHRPPWLVVENVREFREWGPVGKRGKPLRQFRGKFFDNWLRFLRAAGYRVDHELLNAADYGAATSRERLFVIARRGHRDPVFPSPTHAGCRRTAGEIIDWSIPCEPVHQRCRPLACDTWRRIERGMERFTESFLIHYYGTLNVSPLDEPLDTITVKPRHALVVREPGSDVIGLRMLQNHELAAAQGFPGDYWFAGNKAQVTKQIGNSVSPDNAAAITAAIAAA